MSRRLAGMLSVLLLTLPAATFGAAADDELLRKIELLEQQLQELKAVQKAGMEKKADCMKAVGMEKFCGCLVEKLPREVGFLQYVSTAVATRESLGIDRLPVDQRRRVEVSLEARDVCAGK